MQSLFSLLCVRWPQHKTRCSRGLRPRVTMSFVRGYSPDLFVLASYFASQGSQLTQCLFGLFGVRGFSVPFGKPFHKRNSLTRNGVGDNYSWPIIYSSCVIYSVNNLFNVMPVNVQNMPVKSFIFIFQWLKGHNVFGVAVNLNIISVDKGS